MDNKENYNELYDSIIKNISELPDISELDKKIVDEKKPNLFIRFLKYFIPWKGDKVTEVIRKIVFLTALTVFISMIVVLLPYFLEPIQNNNLNNRLRDMYGDSENLYSSPIRNPRFDKLYAENKDIVGWIKIDGTNIDYPVVQTQEQIDNDDYYLRRDFYKEYSSYGTVFAEKTNSLKYMQESKNITLYGHNMKDDSSMFSQLVHYSELNFYKQHPTFRFDTLYRDGYWKVVAVMITNTYAYQNNNYVFDYRKTNFTSDEQFLYWINECKKRSIINTGVQVDKSDEILTLQTCTYEFRDARFVVIARRVRTGESKSVNTAAAVVNKDPVYPQVWYDVNGLDNPHKNDKPQDMGIPDTTKTANTTAPVTKATYAKTTQNNKTTPKTTSGGGIITKAPTAAPTQPPTQPPTNPPTAAPTQPPTQPPTVVTTQQATE